MPEETKQPDTKTPAETVPEKQPQDSPAPAKPDAVPESKQPPELPAPDEMTNLRTELAKAQMERTAAIEAVKLGIDPKQVPYVLRLMEMPDSGKDEDIAAAIQKVLDDVPAFKASASGTAPEIRIGAKAPQANETNDALASAFGNVKKN